MDEIQKTMDIYAGKLGSCNMFFCLMWKRLFSRYPNYSHNKTKTPRELFLWVFLHLIWKLKYTSYSISIEMALYSNNKAITTLNWLRYFDKNF